MLKVLNTNLESGVRTYCRSFPDAFVSAKGAEIISVSGKAYIDFLSGCGSLNYGHNDPVLCDALLEYITEGGISMSLDMRTASKDAFMESFRAHILEPRDLPYLMQFTGPTGANAVEAALKLARKVTGRTNVVGFTNAFHGCSLGALALTANGHHRGGSAALLGQVTRHPFDGYLGPSLDTAAYLERLLDDPASGVDEPAAIVVECIQGEGGLNVASDRWLHKLQQVARRHGALLIVDDIQAGCGRSGDFFSFEQAGIEPDIVVLAKSISGYGLPMSLVLLRPEHDAWEPGEHNGTFRGNNLAFVTASAALETYWATDALTGAVRDKERVVRRRLREIAEGRGFQVKGRGLILGIDVGDSKLSARIRQTAFEHGLIVEACGPTDAVVKVMPPLTIAEPQLARGLDLLSKSIEACADTPRADRASALEDHNGRLLA